MDSAAKSRFEPFLTVAGAPDPAPAPDRSSP